MRSLKFIYPDYQDRVNFIAVSQDLTEPRETLEEHRKSEGYPWNVYEGNIEILKDYRILSQASKVIVDRSGVIVAREGYGVQSDSFWQGVLSQISKDG